MVSGLDDYTYSDELLFKKFNCINVLSTYMYSIVEPLLGLLGSTGSGHAHELPLSLVPLHCSTHVLENDRKQIRLPQIRC